MEEQLLQLEGSLYLRCHLEGLGLRLEASIPMDQQWRLRAWPLTQMIINIPVMQKRCAHHCGFYQKNLGYMYIIFSFSMVLSPADDCQQMFLHPVNVRCLLREYGSLEACPDSITATVVEIVGHTVTEVSKQGDTNFI